VRWSSLVLQLVVGGLGLALVALCGSLLLGEPGQSGGTLTCQARQPENSTVADLRVTLRNPGREAGRVSVRFTDLDLDRPLVRTDASTLKPGQSVSFHGDTHQTGIIAVASFPSAMHVRAELTYHDALGLTHAQDVPCLAETR
jgi:hypothetical protein